MWVLFLAGADGGLVVDGVVQRRAELLVLLREVLHVLKTK
jgi:hypothetical protein